MPPCAHTPVPVGPMPVGPMPVWGPCPEGDSRDRIPAGRGSPLPGRSPQPASALPTHRAGGHVAVPATGTHPAAEVEPEAFPSR
jgi:hypothetical protein